MVENMNSGKPRPHHLLFSATENIAVLWINILSLFFFFFWGGVMPNFLTEVLDSFLKEGDV